MPEPTQGAREEVLVVGPGAIGALVAARLSHAGHPVTVACRTDDRARELGEKGVFAMDHDGRVIHGDVRTVCAPEEYDGDPALAVVATKCADAVDAMDTWAGALPQDTPVVAMQNGLMGDALMDAAGGRLVECVVAFPATMERPGHSIQTGPGGFHLGVWPPRGRDGDTPRPSDRAVEHAAEILRAVAPATVERDITGAKWSKLIINSCITTLGVVSGTDLGDLLKEPRARDIFLAVATEGYHAGHADGVRFTKVAGFAPGIFAYRHDEPTGRWWRHLLLRLVGRKARRQRSSSLQSLERGQKTEVAYLNGAIVETAARHGVPAPVNEALVALVARIESGQVRPGMANLEALPVRT